MKKIVMVIMAAMLLGMATLAVGCGGNPDKAEFEAYVAGATEYAKSNFQLKGEAKVAAIQLNSDLEALKWDSEKTYEENKAVVDEIVGKAFDKITTVLAPKYDPSASGISNFIYSTGELAGKLKCNDMYTELLSLSPGTTPEAAVQFSISVGGGRASYTAGEITGENHKAIYTVGELSRICTIKDEALKTKLLNVKNVSDIIRSCKVSFAHDSRFTMTTHYTQLGVDYLNAIGEEVELYQEYYVFGTYQLNQTAISGTNEYSLNVVLDDETKLEFVFNTSTNEVYAKNYIFTRMPMIFRSEMTASLGGYPDKVEFKEGTTKLENQRYGNNSEREIFDIFLPANFDKNRAGGNGVILFIHGGSWTSGSKEDVTKFCAYYANLGYVTAAMNHTYCGGAFGDDPQYTATFLDIENEIDLVFKKIKEMSDEKGWNITKGATYGYSSGSHLAAWYAYGKGHEETAPIPIVMTFSMVGPMSFYNDCWLDGNRPIGQQLALLGLNDKNLWLPDEDKKAELDELMAGVMNGSISRTEINSLDFTPYTEAEFNAKIDRISPLSYVKKGSAVPTVLGEACADPLLISGEHGIQMEAALTAAGVEHDVIMFPQSSHSCEGNEECGNVFRMRAEEYLKKYFGY